MVYFRVLAPEKPSYWQGLLPLWKAGRLNTHVTHTDTHRSYLDLQKRHWGLREEADTQMVYPKHDTEKLKWKRHELSQHRGCVQLSHVHVRVVQLSHVHVRVFQLSHVHVREDKLSQEAALNIHFKQLFALNMYHNLILRYSNQTMPCRWKRQSLKCVGPLIHLPSNWWKSRITNIDLIATISVHIYKAVDRIFSSKKNYQIKSKGKSY